MTQKTIAVIIVLFSIVIAGMFGFAFMKKTEISNEQPADHEQTQNDARYASITRIDGTHYYIDGVHTVVGEVPMPTPCDLLEANALIAESYPEQITLDFTVINNASFCDAQVTPQRFKVSATASEEALFQARFMGRDVELNLIPAAPGEVPEDFEIFIKG